MVKMTIYDPALCCPTGVCGPEVDPALVRFAADLEWLRARGVEVRRFNLAHEPAAFARSGLVRRQLQEEGTDCLPLLLVGAEVVSSGRYPDRDELAAWSAVDMAAEAVGTRPTPVVAEEAAESRTASPGLLVLGGGESPDDGSTPCC